MPRLRKVLEKARAPVPVAIRPRGEAVQPVKKSLRASTDPENFSLHSQKLYDGVASKLGTTEAHFPVGGKQIWFPWSPITLLPPSARMTPYQAQFQVPLNFNKLDMRDYLWHLYGLRALNVTTQIKHSRWAAAMPRYRLPQVKKMIVDMEEPFIWPEMDEQVKRLHRIEAEGVMRTYNEFMKERFGSDLKKPLEQVADGVLGPFPEAPRGFVPKQLRRKMENAKKRENKGEMESVVAAFLKL